MTIRIFKKGDRVELHPALDLWMRGARYDGEVVKIGPRVCHVRLDAFPTRKRAFTFPYADLRLIDREG